MYPYMRPKVRAILNDLEAHGWQPIIDPGVHRTPAEQLEKFKAGYSKVKYSYHNVTGKDGTPESLAADIVDVRYAWNSPKSFWLMLAAAAESHGLDSGIYWGLTNAQRQVIHTAIAKRDFNNPKIPLGWDTAHVEVHGISLLAARLGKRPK